MQELIQLPLETNRFEANGTVYTFEEKLSIERYMRFNEFRLMVGFGTSIEDLRALIQKNVDMLQRVVSEGKNVLGEMLALNYNALRGVIDTTAKEPYAVWLCTLFFNTPDEDRRRFDQEVMRKKIVDWQEAGIDNAFFIYRACALIEGFSKIYEEITRQFSENPINPDPTTETSGEPIQE